MENQTRTEIICILDNSGSMQTLQLETIEGLNQFIREQKQEVGHCHFTLVQFNQDVVFKIQRQAIKEVALLDRASYHPNGYTALLDAVGLTLKTAMETVFMLPPNEAPGHVLVFIITDGLENASRHYSKEQIREMVGNLTVHKGWEFQFFGANIDAFGEAQNIGIARDKAEAWDYNQNGVQGMMNKMSAKTSAFRKRGN